MANVFSKLLSFGEGKQLKKFKANVDKINAVEPEMQERTDEGLKQLAAELREKASNGADLDSLLVEAFALVRESSRRTIGLRHFDVQLIGAMALHEGCIAEMKTGEGKTLVSTAAGFLNALDGSNVHVVTVNDYLAQRDAEWMGQIYAFLDMRAGVILNQMQPAQRRESYAADVTYGTNSEFGFDYLRDNMVTEAENRVQRGHTFAIVDEVDSILIDEARTPLIISGLGGSPAQEYSKFAAIMPLLKPEEDFVYDEKKKTIYATEEGLDRIEEMLGFEIYDDVTGMLANHLKQALKAEFMFHKDIDYVVADGEVKIVDEFTGRIMEGRRWSEGLHQAVEAKEGVAVQSETHTLATITLQNYFRLYKKLSGMTGTAITEDAEFRQIYNLPVVTIPTNKPMIRQDHPDYIFRTKDAKFEAVAKEIGERNKTGQPVLVGTTSIEDSEKLSRVLQKHGIRHQVLNAKNPRAEAGIVAQAGRAGAVTIATNMAGRGTDILLGGNRDALEQEWLRMHPPRDPEAGYSEWEILESKRYADEIVDTEGHFVRNRGGLVVFGTERHEARRVDNQLRGRSGRQGDPGESRFYLSLDDNLLRRFGGDRLDTVSAMMEKRGIPDETPLEDALVSKVIDTAQRQVESIHFNARKDVLEYDDVMNLQRKAVYEERNAILDGKDIEESFPQIIDDVVGQVIEMYCPDRMPSDDWDIEGLMAWLVNLMGPNDFDPAPVITEDDDPTVLQDALAEYLAEKIDEKREKVGAEKFAGVVKLVMLQVLDRGWIDHLTEMDYLKTGIGLRAYGQRDPLVEYKEEAYNSFADLTSSIYHDMLSILLHMPVDDTVDEVITEADNPFDPDKMVYSDGSGDLGGASNMDVNVAGDNPLLNRA